MIVPDANLLLYAYAPNSPFHKKSLLWLEGIFSSAEAVGIPIHSIYAFMRIITHPKVYAKPIPMQLATETVESWLALPHVRILYPVIATGHCSRTLHCMGRSEEFRSPMPPSMLSHREYGGVVHTNNRDFARFPNLRWLNPIQPLTAMKRAGNPRRPLLSQLQPPAQNCLITCKPSSLTQPSGPESAQTPHPHPADAPSPAVQGRRSRSVGPHHAAKELTGTPACRR